MDCWRIAETLFQLLCAGSSDTKSLLIRWFTCDGRRHHDDWSSNALSWQRCLLCASASVKPMHEWVHRVCWAHLRAYITDRGFFKRSLAERMYTSLKRKEGTLYINTVSMLDITDSTRQERDGKYSRVSLHDQCAAEFIAATVHNLIYMYVLLKRESLNIQLYVHCLRKSAKRQVTQRMKGGVTFWKQCLVCGCGRSTWLPDISIAANL